MEIDVTKFVEKNKNNMMSFASSQDERGRQAGELNWQDSLVESKKHEYITEENAQKFKDWCVSTGGWDHDEVSEWNLQEMNAFFLQFVAGDYREMMTPGFDPEAQGGRLYQSANSWYYYVGT